MEKIIVDENQFLRTISRISHEIIEKHQTLDNLEEEMSPIYKGASMQMNIQNKEIILVDDVLFTGRTIRAALDALTDFGRASRIELVIFVDRGHRELPIRADYVGKNVPTSRNENIQVRTKQFDQCYEVALLSK